MHRSSALPLLLAALGVSLGATLCPVPLAAQATTTCPACPADVLAIDAGGPTEGAFSADKFFLGGLTSSTDTAIDLTGVTSPAPEAVYQNQRYGNVTYTLPGLSPSTAYTVRLHFAEHYWTKAGQRTFNVSINGAPVLSNFDIIAAANGPKRAIIEQFKATSNPSGQITVQFTTLKDNAQINGIEIVGAAAGTSPVAAAPVFTPAGGTFAATTSVTLGEATPGAVLHYTTNGSTPTAQSPIYAGPIAVAASETLEAIAVAAGYTNSAVSAAAYTIKPTTPTPPPTGPSAAPTSLTAVASTSTQTYVNWVASTTPGAQYSVYRGTSAGFAPSAATLVASTGAITNFSDRGLLPSKTYFYIVSAGGSASTPAVPVTTLGAATAGAPAVVTGLSATASSANEIDLTWNASTALGVNYEIFRDTTPGFTPARANQIGSTKANLYQDVTLPAGTRFFYAVKASNSTATSTATPAVNASTAALGSATPFWDEANIPPAQNVLTYKFLNRTNGKYTDDQVFWRVTINKVTTTKSIAEQPTFDMPANSSGRIYFYLGTVGQGPTNFYDFVEYTVGPASINTNTTRVDAFGIKLAMHLTCGDGTNIAVGENAATFAEDRATTFARYLAAVPTPFQAEGQKFAPYRIVEPGAGGFNAGGPEANYYTDYINEVYSSNGLTVVKAGPNGSGLGAYPNLSAAIYRHVASQGTFYPNGSLVSQDTWGNPANFYQNDPSDYYAQFLHANAINGHQYAFPYDDAGGYSSDISCSKPTKMVIAIGW